MDGNEHKNDMEDEDDMDVETNENEKRNDRDMFVGRENDNENDNDNEASDLMRQDEVENEEMEEDAPVPLNKYDAIYTHTLNSNIQSSNEILMEKVIKALQEDQVTSSTFENTHPLYLIIQDCRLPNLRNIHNNGYG